jgi:hypothetical protein
MNPAAIVFRRPSADFLTERRSARAPIEERLMMETKKRRRH